MFISLRITNTVEIWRKVRLEYLQLSIGTCNLKNIMNFSLLKISNPPKTVTLTEPTGQTVVLASRFIILYNVQYTKI